MIVLGKLCLHSCWLKLRRWFTHERIWSGRLKKLCGSAFYLKLRSITRLSKIVHLRRGLLMILMRLIENGRGILNANVENSLWTLMKRLSCLFIRTSHECDLLICVCFSYHVLDPWMILLSFGRVRKRWT